MKKLYKNGLVIGKFYPFHNGHKYLIETAIKNSKKVTVILCQTARYQIDPSVRASWIKETFPNIDVRVFEHDASLDSDSTDISETWAKITVSFLGYIPDAVFSSELYGEPYSKAMGSKHVLVDLERKNVPISATKIRSDVNKYWDFLPEVTKKFFTIRVVILGAESTGTTTLAKSLAEHYQTPWVPEYGRLYYEGKMTSKDLDSWTTSEFLHIARMQNQIEDSLAGISNRVLVCDTDAFATSVWHERYVGFEDLSVTNEINSEFPALYILTDIDIPFVQDGTRDGEKIRSWMHQKFLDKLTCTNRQFIIVSGNRESRLKFAIEAIEKEVKKQNSLY